MTAEGWNTDRLLPRPVRDDDIVRILAYRNLSAFTRWLLRTEVDPDALRAAWLGATEDPDDHGVAVVLDEVVISTVSRSTWSTEGAARHASRHRGLASYVPPRVARPRVRPGPAGKAGVRR